MSRGYLAAPSQRRAREHDPRRPRSRRGRTVQPPCSMCTTAHNLTSGECTRTCSRVSPGKVVKRIIPGSPHPFAELSKYAENDGGDPDCTRGRRAAPRTNHWLSSTGRSPSARAIARWVHVQSRSPPTFSQHLPDPSKGSGGPETICLTTFDSGDRRVKIRARGVTIVKFGIVIYPRARPFKPMPPADQACKSVLEVILSGVPGGAPSAPRARPLERRTL